MIIWSYSNIDIIQGVLGYGNVSEGITDWRITNTNTGIFNILNSSSIIRPSGGTSEIGEISGSTDRYMIFSAGTSTFTVPSGSIVCDILIVGGGGGGGAGIGSGGGAGGLLYYTGVNISAGIYTIIVGEGGAGAVNYLARGANGNNSSAFGYIAYGGGGGAGQSWVYNTSGTASGTLQTTSANQGSGAGGTRYKTLGNAGTAGQGYSGGNIIEGGNIYSSGGGGGAGGVGGNGSLSSPGGIGGIGVSSSITGTSIDYAGGGGGVKDNYNTPTTFTGSSASYGGGAGGVPTGANGTDGKGGGGGGGGGEQNPSGGKGGSGIVIIRYRTANISIIDNGNVGIGTIPLTSSSLLEVVGDVNIIGNYKRNNVDVINATSNYVLSTSNILVSNILTNIRNTSNYVSTINTSLNTRINDTSNYMLTTSNILANLSSSQWTSTSSGIYYNTPISTPITLPNEIGVEKYMIFTYTGDTISGSGQTQYTINIPTGGIVCDILMVGGGGGGGNDRGGGGGGGGVIYSQNITLNGTFTILVGNGGIGATSGLPSGSGTRGTSGVNTSISGSSLTTITAIGGGTGGSCHPSVKNGLDGGSGGGGSQYGGAGSGGIGTAKQGNNGGIGYEGGAAGGGGGAVAIGTNATSTNAGNGGNGISISITGTSVIYGSGGGGGGSFGSGIGGYNQVFGTGGSIGAGNGANVNANGDNATIYGCGGGGGGLATTIVTKGGNGAPGVIIIKYFSIQQTIQKSISSSPVITQTVLTGITTGTIGTTDSYMIFSYTIDNTGSGQTQYTINIKENLICDLLIVGGGGGGGRRHGGGGGAGTLIYQKNIIVDGTYTVRVGKGGQGCQSSTVVTANTIGYSSQFIKSDNSQEYLATGGGNGGAGVIQASTTNGGGTNTVDSNLTLNTTNKINGNIVSVVNKQYVNTLTSPQGCRGNMGGIMTTSWRGGGGGGAGSAGMDHSIESSVLDGYGGLGLAIDITGTSVIYAGGGCGSEEGGTLSQVFDPSYPTIQSRGGGGFGSDNGTPQNGLDGTGGGGGGQAADTVNGGNGGSGIVIIRYRKNTTTAYVGLGTTNPVSELHVYDDTVNNTKLTIQNNYIEPVVVTPNIIESLVLPNLLFASNPTGVTSGTINDTDRFYIFTHTGGYNTNTGYTVSIPNGITFDILMIGGGGAGGGIGGAGGGSGACLIAVNQTLTAGTYTFAVGGAGSGGITGSGNPGYDTFIGANIYKARGGGGGAADAKNGVIGGSTGGAAGGINNVVYISPSPSTDNYYQSQASGPIVNTSFLYSIYGNKGGDVTATTAYETINYGGGGGIGAAAANANSTTRSTPGGDGLYQVTLNGTLYNFRTYFTNNETFGVQDGTTGNFFIGGGGGGGGYNPSITPTNISGGKGGGGIGKNGNSPANGTDGTTNTGSGGGAGSTGLGGNSLGGNGGSGLLIFRYRNRAKYRVTETLESNIYYRTLTFAYSPNYPPDPPNTTLLAWYKFDGDGLDYTPWTTKYNLIANVGTATYSSGTTADSFFQGRRYVNTATGSLKTSLTLRVRAFSVAVWVRTKTTSGGQIVVQSASIGGNTSLILYCGGNNTYNLAYYGNDLNSASSYPADVNVWVHLVFVVLPNNNRRVYRNGVLISTDANGTSFSGSGDLRIGASYTDNASQNIDISDLRIYNNGISNTDVEKLYYSYTTSLNTDNYGINFTNTLGLTVNGTSKTVKGLYNISTGNINSSIVPLEGQTDTPLASTAITTVSIKYPYDTPFPILPNEINVGNNIMIFTYTGDTIANSGQTQYTITVPTGGVVCDILIVAGGGSGGQTAGGGGGAGGLIYLSNQNITTGNYNVFVGRGGTATLYQGGFNSSFGTNIAIGGGVGSSMSGTLPGNGGSGGGGNRSNTTDASVPGQTGGSGTANQGNAGGQGKNFSGSNAGGGGGGGAGAAGVSAFTTGRGANGGIGLANSINGTTTYYAGGGGGGSGSDFTVAGTGGLGSGGNGAIWANTGGDGTPNTGGGGGGGSAYPGDGRFGGSGGSGIIIIKNYTIEKYITSSPQITNITKGTIGTSDRTISFRYIYDSPGLTGQTLYTFTPSQNVVCDILVVGGGGGGGKGGGGGGGGGVLFGVNLKLNSGSSVSVKVGNGGTGATTNDNAVNGINGYDSSITINSIEYIAKGGGGGGTRGVNAVGTSGNAGGSGGGGSHANSAPQGLGGASNKNNYANFQSFGNSGGLGKLGTSAPEPSHASGGGGGAGSVGSNATGSGSGKGGGDGGFGKEFIAYFGRSVGHNGYFAGGGGGQTYNNAGIRGFGNGGLELYGGGGNAGFDGTMAYFADNGMPNTGGGGGGAFFSTYSYNSNFGGNGGSGFVIIRYRINTMQTASIELSRTIVPPNEILVSGATTTTIGQFDRLISFPYTSDSTGVVGQTQYIFTTTEPLICDILIIGGGGGGGRRHGGGGGAGTLIYQKNIIVDGTYTVRVGKGGQGCQSSTVVTANTIGYSSQFIKSDSSQEYLATGGGNGGAGTIQASTTNGGGTNTVDSNLTLNTTNKINGNIVSVVNKQYVNTLTSPQGCRGNMGGIMTTSWKGGGGGGAGGAGMNHDEEATVFDGYGGIGLAIDITGTSVIYAGGGNGSDYYGSISQVFDPLYTTIQSRGGGGYGSDNGTPQNGLDGTGGGGGGQGFDNVNGGNGGSGIVIIRYRRNTGYKIGNYNGDFKIISTLTANDTDYMRITRDGASIYNPTGSPLWSTVSDRRIKENIEKASYDKCYDNINKLELYRFNYIKELNNINKDNKQLGYIAQEVEDVFPKAVSTQPFYNNSLSISDLLSIDISQINYSLYGSVKKLIDMYNDIEKRVEALEKILNIENNSNIDIQETLVTTSNFNIDIFTSNNISFYTPIGSNIIVDTLTTSNVIDILSTSAVSIYTSNNTIYDISTSNNISFYNPTEANIAISITESTTSNVVIE